VQTRPALPPTVFPSSATTGPVVPLTTSGPVTADSPGQVVENLDIRGELNVTAPDVVVRNVRVRGGDTSWLVILRNDTGTTTLDSVAVEGDAGAIVGLGVFQAGEGPLRMRATRITGTQDGCACARGSIVDSYIALGPNRDGAHNDGIQSGGGTGFTVRHNTIFNSNGQTSAIALFDEHGPQVDVRIENNLLAGGGFAIYAGDGTHRPSGVQVIGNVFSRRFFANGGAYGPARAWCANCAGARWTGNVWEGTGRPVDP
jgi:hypothetical protein